MHSLRIDALDLAKEYPGRIDVLVSDVEFQPEIQVRCSCKSLFVFPLRLACVNCNPAAKSGICIPIEFRLRWRSRSAASLTFALSQ